MGHDSHSSESHVDTHQVKAEMIKELSPYYDQHDLSLIGKATHFIQHLLEEQHHAHVSTEKYVAKPVTSYSEREQISRGVFALKKIKTFNHGFFTTEEEMIIDPLPLGSFTFGMKYLFSGIDAAILTYMWRNWSFNRRSVALVGGLIAVQSAMLHAPNIVNEVLIQTPRRRTLAARYIDRYGPNFLHDIVSPAYDIDHLRHLTNKLKPN